MFILKVSFYLVFVSFCLGGKILDYKEKQFYESDFFSYFPKSEWQKLNDNTKRENIFNGFVKQVSSV